MYNLKCSIKEEVYAIGGDFSEDSKIKYKQRLTLRIKLLIRQNFWHSFQNRT